ELARGIGQHRARVELLLAGVLRHAVGVARRPLGLGGPFHRQVVVLVFHDWLIVGNGGRGPGLRVCRALLPKPWTPDPYFGASATNPIRDSPALCTRPMTSTTLP